MAPPRSSRRKMLVAVALGAVALLCLWLYIRHVGTNATERVPIGSARASNGAHGAIPLSLTRRAGISSGDGPAVSVPLPPPGTQVTDVLASLRDAADHGDARAACRLGLDLGRCWVQRRVMHSAQSDLSKAIADHAAAEKLALFRRAVDRLTQAFAADAALCEGVDDADVSEAWSYTLQAASAGSAAAASEFLVEPPTEPFEENSSVLDAWAENRDKFLQMGLASGSFKALMDGYLVARSGYTLGGPSRSPGRDPYKAVVYGTALLPLMVGKLQDVYRNSLREDAAKLSPDLAAQAKAEGERLHDQYFSSTAPVTHPFSVEYREPDVEGCAKLN